MAREPETRYTNSGKCVTSFTLAVSRRYNKNSEQQQADFISCIAWEKLGEIVGNNLRKGSQVLVDGRLQVRSYDGNDGNKKYVTEVVAQDVEFIGNKPHGQNSESNGANEFGNEIAPDGSEEIPW